MLNKVSDFGSVGYICLECGAVLLVPVQLMVVRVDVLVRQVTSGGVKDRIDVYALGAGGNRPGTNMRN